MKVGDYIVTVKHPKTGKPINIPLKVLLAELNSPIDEE